MPDDKIIQRDAPEPETGRARLVQQWQDRVIEARDHWSNIYEQMRRDQQFVRGEQWHDDPDAYVVNVTLRHVQGKVDAVYAKNPTHVFRQVEKIENVHWDGTIETLAAANVAIQNFFAGAASGPEQVGALQQAQAGALQQAQAVVAEARQLQEFREQRRRMGRTLELLYEHQLREQAVSFKKMGKRVVRRAFTTGVSYIKPGFQRITQQKPETVRAINDVSEQLAQIERRAADLADGEIEADSEEAETLRAQLRDLQSQPEIVVRQGLTLDYPASTAIIPDINTTFLPDFIGADWVAEEFELRPSRIKEIYGVDVSESFQSYQREKPSIEVGSEDNLVREAIRVMETRSKSTRSSTTAGGSKFDDKTLARVWEIYAKAEGLVYVVCEGYPDFLVEPGAPDVWTERFYPWYVYAPNATEDESNPFPPSDVSLVRDPQKEINRAKEGLREHRHAARPKTFSTKPLSDKDREALTTHPANAILELDAVQPGEKVTDVLQSYAGPGIDRNLYETGSSMQDVLLAGGSQEANLGTTSGATATESALANDSRLSTTASAIDDLEELFGEVARAASQILFTNMDAGEVRRLVGEGAVWPDLNRKQVAEELYLTVEAGSTGRPNQAQEVQVRERLLPFLLQLPGIKPSYLAKDALRVLDPNMRIEDALDVGQMAIQTANALAQGQAAFGGAQVGDPTSDPRAQGPAGANNAPSSPGPQPGGVPAQQVSASDANGSALPVV